VGLDFLGLGWEFGDAAGKEGDAVGFGGGEGGGVRWWRGGRYSLAFFFVNGTCGFFPLAL
jgi:hypothetical protein